MDVEAEAAALFSDEPKKAEAAPTTIKFKCEWCDFDIELGVDMAGKRSPCPDCRRITKVPDLAKPVKKDWLKNAQPEAPPEGASGSGKGATMVSEEALEAAGAIPDDPLTRGQKAVRATPGVLCVLLLLRLQGVWGVVALVERPARSRRRSTPFWPIRRRTRPSPGSAMKAWPRLHIAAGEYYRLTRRRPSARKKAREQFKQALAHLGQAKAESLERDAVLMDLAQAQLEMGGNEQEVEKGLRLKWNDVHKDLLATLVGINDEEMRLLALRWVSRRLISRDRSQLALDLANQAFADGKKVPKYDAGGGHRPGIAISAFGKKPAR